MSALLTPISSPHSPRVRSHGNAFVLAVLLLSFATAAAADDGKASAPAVAADDNAALALWHAFALLPPVEQDEAVADVLAKPHDAPLDKTVVALVGRAGLALDGLQRASEMPAADWGMRRYLQERGFEALLPHLAKARLATKLAVLRSRLRMQAGDHLGAMNDAVAIAAMGRHLATDPLLINLLVQIAIEEQAIELLRKQMGSFTDKELAHLKKRLAGLPKRATAAQAIRFEGDVSLGWIDRRLDEMAKIQPGGRAAALGRMLGAFGPDGAAKATGGLKIDAKTAEDWLNETRGFYILGEAALKKPWQEVPEAVADLTKTVTTSKNALAAVIFPSALGGWERSQASLAKFAMLQAAVQHRLDPKARAMDPFSEEPLSHKAAEGARVYESALKIQGKPVSLKVTWPKP